MKLFSGIACFSPTVSIVTKNLWALYGGETAEMLEEKRRPQWYFCNGLGDVWLAELTKCPVVVFHVNWIHASVSAKFVMPLANFVLDDDYTPSSDEFNKIEDQGSHLSGNSQEVTEINARNEKDVLNTKSTRLATNADRVYLRKRPREMSAGNRIGSQLRVVKKLKRGSERSLVASANWGSEDNYHLITESRLPVTIKPMSEKASRLLTMFPSSFNDSSSTSSPLLTFHGSKTTNSGLEPSDKRNSIRASAFTPISINVNSAGCSHNQDSWDDHTNEYPLGSKRSTQTLSTSVSNSDFLSSVDKSSLLSLCAPDDDIWQHIAREARNRNTFSGTSSSDPNPLPTIFVPDALKLLKEETSGGRVENIALFIPGHVFCGKRFSVVDNVNRRTTI